MKTKKRLLSLITAMMISFSAVIMVPMTVFADAAAVQNAVNQKCDDGNFLPSGISGYFSETQTSEKSEAVSLGAKVKKTYYYNPAEEEKILEKINIQANTEDINAALDQFNYKADVASAAGYLDGFKRPLEIFLGIMVTLITIGMTVFTTLDLCYIAFPVFRGKMDDAKASGTKGLTRSGKDGETKLNFITEDAQYAMTAANMAETGQNPFLIYAKKRVLSFIILAILLFILVTGKINVFANLGIKLANGILNVLSGAY